MLVKNIRNDIYNNFIYLIMGPEEKKIQIKKKELLKVHNEINQYI